MLVENVKGFLFLVGVYILRSFLPFSFFTYILSQFQRTLVLALYFLALLKIFPNNLNVQFSRSSRFKFEKRYFTCCFLPVEKVAVLCVFIFDPLCFITFKRETPRSNSIESSLYRLFECVPWNPWKVFRAVLSSLLNPGISWVCTASGSTELVLLRLISLFLQIQSKVGYTSTLKQRAPSTQPVLAMFENFHLSKWIPDFAIATKNSSSESEIYHFSTNVTCLELKEVSHSSPAVFDGVLHYIKCKLLVVANLICDNMSSMWNIQHEHIFKVNMGSGRWQSAVMCFVACIAEEVPSHTFFKRNKAENNYSTINCSSKLFVSLLRLRRINCAWASRSQVLTD